MYKKHKIDMIYYPISLSSNKYVDIVQNILSEIGVNIYGFKSCISFKRLKRIDIVNLNWFESRVNQKSYFKSFASYLSNTFLVHLFRMFHIKIVVTMHNIVTHDAFHPVIVEQFFKWLCKKSDAIVVMNNHSIRCLEKYSIQNEKVFLIPMPSYINVYNETNNPEKNIRKKYNEDSFELLFVGLIRPYKNIEVILNVANEICENIHFTICGFAKDNEYKSKIESMANSRNVTLDLRFVSDDEMIERIEQSDAVILPYDNRSSLNSSAAILAFSYSTTVIGTSTGTLKEYDDDLVYAYDYRDEQDHKIQLKKAIMEAYNDYCSNRDLYYQKGRRLRENVEKNNSKEVVSDKYVELISYLMNKN